NHVLGGRLVEDRPVVLHELLQLAGLRGYREHGEDHREPAVRGPQEDRLRVLWAALLVVTEVRAAPATAGQRPSIRLERLHHASLGPAAVAGDLELGGLSRRSKLAEPQWAGASRLAPMDEPDPGEVIEVTADAGDQEPCGVDGRGPLGARAVMVDVAG